MLTKSRAAVRVGAQRPRIANVPRARTSSGGEAVEVAAAAGLHLDLWQAWVLEQALGERRDGKWAALEVGLLAPRQSGKNSILEARELTGLSILGERLLLHTAHEAKTGQEHFLRMLDLLEDASDFRPRIKAVRTSHGEEGIEFRPSPTVSSVAGTTRGRSQRLRFVARSRTSGKGFTGDLVVFDEAFSLKPAALSALFPTLASRPNPQVWYTSAAGDDAALELRAIRKRGIEGSPRMAFMEWSAPEEADLDDREMWAVANPGLGIRISEEFIASEREALSDEDFARERLGIWQRGARERVIPETVWEGVQDADSAPSGELVLGLDALPDRSLAAIAGAGDGVVELVAHQVGVGWAPARAVELARKHKASVVVDGNGPAASLADRIEGKGVTVHRLKTAEVADACASFYDAVVAGEISIRPHALLTAAVAGAVKKPVGDRFVWSRSRSGVDVTPLMAASLACYPAPDEGEDFALVV